jgi:DNA-binding HxlR family transcriptional regulator
MSRVALAAVPSAPVGADMLAVEEATSMEVRRLLELAGARWTRPVLESLDEGRLRFGAIGRSLPAISQKQLTHTLRQLERYGFVRRMAFPTIPPRVEYQRTELGNELTAQLVTLGRLALSWGPEMEVAQRRFERGTGFELA